MTKKVKKTPPVLVPPLRRKVKKKRGPSIETLQANALEWATGIILGRETTYGMIQKLDPHYAKGWDDDIERLKEMRKEIKETRRLRKECKDKKSTSDGR